MCISNDPVVQLFLQNLVLCNGVIQSVPKDEMYNQQGYQLQFHIVTQIM